MILKGCETEGAIVVTIQDLLRTEASSMMIPTVAKYAAFIYSRSNIEFKSGW
jgi:hypothetical protein